MENNFSFTKKTAGLLGKVSNNVKIEREKATRKINKIKIIRLNDNYRKQTLDEIRLKIYLNFDDDEREKFKFEMHSWLNGESTLNNELNFKSQFIRCFV